MVCYVFTVVYSQNICCLQVTRICVRYYLTSQWQITIAFKRKFFIISFGEDTFQSICHVFRDNCSFLKIDLALVHCEMYAHTLFYFNAAHLVLKVLMSLLEPQCFDSSKHTPKIFNSIIFYLLNTFPQTLTFVFPLSSFPLLLPQYYMQRGSKETISHRTQSITKL